MRGGKGKSKEELGALVGPSSVQQASFDQRPAENFVHH
jgi:hypothetical protein